jgi:hypothetical protein
MSAALDIAPDRYMITTSRPRRADPGKPLKETVMDKQTFIELVVEEARAKCIGNRARATFNAAAAAAKAAEEWEFIHSPEQVARDEKITALVAKGGKVWENDNETRVYFNAIPVGAVGRTFDCYVNIETGVLHGALTDEERAAAQAIIGA